VRVAIGPIELGDLAPGQWRELTAQERRALGALRSKNPGSPAPRQGARPGL